MAIIPAAAARLAPAAGAALTDLAVKAVKPVLCSAYRSNPGWYTGSPSALGRDVGRVASLAMDSLCSDQPLPPPMTVPFQGGQCQGELYDVTFRQSNPTTGVGNNFTRRLSGKLGGMTQRRIGIDPTSKEPIIRYGFISGVSPTNPNGTDNDLSNGSVKTFLVVLVGIVKVSGSDVCGNPPPSDPPAPIGDSVSFDINLPDLRVSPSANIVVPVVIFKPTLNINPNLNVKFNIDFDVGGLKIVFDGSDFRSGGDIEIDVDNINSNISNVQTNLNTSITSSQTNINNNTNSQATAIRNNINTNTNTQISNVQTNINTNTNSQISSVQTNINNSTNTAIANSQTSINNNTNTQITNLKGDINASLNILKVDLTAQLQFIANLTGVINADLKLALEFLKNIDSKPDCPELPPPPDEIPAPPDEKPPDDGGDSPVKKKLAYVEIILTKRPHKAQFGNNGAQTVYFAGWFAFRANTGGFHPREQINFQRSLFVAPTGCDGYTYTFTHGARGRILEYYV